MDKCRVLPLFPNTKIAKAADELPCLSAMIADGVVPVPVERRRAKVFSFAAARAAAEIRAAKAFTFTEED